MSGTLSGVEGLTALEDQEEVRKVERQLKQRFPIGSQVKSADLRGNFYLMLKSYQFQDILDENTAIQ